MFCRCAAKMGVLKGPCAFKRPQRATSQTWPRMGRKQAIWGPAHPSHAEKGCPNQPCALGLVPNRPENAKIELWR